ncbi:MAG: MarR family transcriptional regulator [Dehalococcoidia bacterium]
MRLYAQAIAIIDPIRIRMWSEAELTTGQLRLMFFLHAEPGATLGALAAHLDIAAPTASGLVDRLTRQDYVRRAEDAQDRRFVRHELTPRGQQIVTELQREGRTLLTEILAALTDDELNTLTRGLQALVAAAANVAIETGAPN